MAPDTSQGSTFLPLQVRDAGNLLTRAGLSIPAVDVDDIVVRYSHPARLIAHLRVRLRGSDSLFETICGQPQEAVRSLKAPVRHAEQLFLPPPRPRVGAAWQRAQSAAGALPGEVVLLHALQLAVK